jgi:hypothetical protein
MSAASEASMRLGFSETPMKPVKSRSCLYAQLDVSSATDASSFTADDRLMCDVEQDVLR